MKTCLPRIAIIGAGPAGLTLARYLQQDKISFQIFDIDASSIARDQGGTLDLHPESGQLALRGAGLFEEFTKRARFEADCIKLVMADATVALDEATDQHKRPEGDKPEIDRLELRNMLLCSLKPGTVRWGYKLLQVEPHAPSSAAERETYTLRFNASGTIYEEGPFDIVIGADGAHSKVRPLLTDKKPFYCGISMVELGALNVDERKKRLADYVGAGSCFMLDEGRGIFAQRNGKGTIRVYVCVRQPEGWFHSCGIDWSAPNTARKQLMDEYFSDCAPEIKNIIIDADDALILRPLDMLPIGVSWAPRGGVTLIGDAAHLMSPFAGQGVNAALQDAMELGQAIIHGVRKNQGINGVTQELAGYEKCMFERTSALAQRTWDHLGICFSRDGAERLAPIVHPRGPAPELEKDVGVKIEKGREAVVVV